MMDTKHYRCIFKKTDKKAIVKNSILIILILLVCYLLRASIKEALLKIKETPLHVVLIIMILSIMYQIFDGLIVTKTLRTCDNTFSYKNGIICSYYYSFFRVVTFGSGTAAAGMYYANKKGIPLQESFGVFTLNYMFQKVAITIYFLIVYILNFKTMKNLYSSYNKYILLGTVVSALVAVVLISVCISEKLHSFVFSLADRYIKKDRYLDKIKDMKEKSGLLRKSSKNILKNKKFVLKVIALNAVKLTCWYMIPMVILSDAGNVQLCIFPALASMAVALSGIIPSPGGIGSTEFIFLIVFGPIVGKIQALSCAILYRFATYLLPFVIGIFTIHSS